MIRCLGPARSHASLVSFTSAQLRFTKLMGFQRVGIVVGYRSINTLGVEFLTSLMRDDVAEGRYNWTVLFTAQITSTGNIEDAQSAAEEIERKDSRINIMGFVPDRGGDVFVPDPRAKSSFPILYFHDCFRMVES